MRIVDFGSLVFSSITSFSLQYFVGFAQFEGLMEMQPLYGCDIARDWLKPKRRAATQPVDDALMRHVVVQLTCLFVFFFFFLHMII